MLHHSRDATCARRTSKKANVANERLTVALKALVGGARTQLINFQEMSLVVRAEGAPCLSVSSRELRCCKLLVRFMGVGGKDCCPHQSDADGPAVITPPPEECGISLG